MEDESNFCWTTLYIFIFSFLGSLCSMLLAQLLCLSLVSPFMPMWIIKRKEDEKIRYRVRLAVNNCRKKKKEEKVRAHFRAFAQQAGFVPGSKVKRSPIVLKF